ncbi:MAG: FAD-binding oxidoreductase, partial [Pseudomonadota bacterium]
SGRLPNRRGMNGLNVLRYGMARDLCLGIEAVLPNGEVLHGLKRLRKDNTGYDIRHLMIGAEGSLGVITGASLKLSPRPTAFGTAMMVVSDPAAALALYHMASGQLGDAISAFEMMSGVGLGFLEEAKFDIRVPFDRAPAWSVLMEIGVFGGRDPASLLEALFETASDAGLVGDGVIASSGTQRDELWKIRESIPLANKAVGSIASHDISLPLSEIPRFLTEAPDVLTAKAPVRINAFGHLGDGNLHFNLFPPQGQSRDAFDSFRHELSDIVFDLVAERGGSFSAEHGVGRLKVDALEKYADPARLAAMKAIKAAFDPKGIMNPGVVLRAE